MSAIDFMNVQELTPAEICNLLQADYYDVIKTNLKKIQNYSEMPEGNDEEMEQAGLLILLFAKLEDETQQMMRNDELIIFPLIRNDEQKKSCGATKMPIDMIQQMHKKIMTVLEKIRQVLNNYLPKPNWEAELLETSNSMFRLEQQLQQAIYLKENQLLHKVKDRFNQKCSGNCKKLKE